jgi:hypothetical protein
VLVASSITKPLPSQAPNGQLKALIARTGPARS